ncbi:adiponectin receptor [Marchantia polymorpha subsp. ruderalis]
MEVQSAMDQSSAHTEFPTNLRERRSNVDCAVRDSDSNQGMSKYVPDSISSGAQRLKREVNKRYELVKFQALPEHLKDNEYIFKHYRADWPIREALGSIFTIHNETLNIWTHLLGFFVFMGLTIYTAMKMPSYGEIPGMMHHLPNFQQLRWQSVTDELTNMVAPQPQKPISRWPFFVFLSGAMFCLLSSSICHLLYCHSQRMANLLLKLDYIGIAYLIAASFYPPVYYTFMCNPTLRNTYLIGITCLGLCTIAVSLMPMFQTHQFRPFRAILFASMGISGIVPCVHKLLLHWGEPAAQTTFYLEMTMGALYGLGAVIYATRVPERWKPGHFDIAGHSHQLFHVLVVAGALTHYRAGLLYLKWRDEQGCEAM